MKGLKAASSLGALASGVVFGLGLLTPGVPQPQNPATYSSQVAKILNDHCLTCHRPGEAAPFSLVGYENARRWARMIAFTTERGVMPPWKATAGGPFHDENRLEASEIAALQEWAKAGAPAGDLARAPKPTLPATTGWRLGKPDLELVMPAGFRLAAEGQDEYWHFVLKPDIKEPVYVSAMDVQPGNRKIVHHVIAFIDEKDRADRMLARNPSALGYTTSGGGIGFDPSGSLGGWAPGLQPRRLPKGAGILVKPGSSIVLQVHYHKSGKEETDRTKVGLYLEKAPIQQPVQLAWMANPMISIPAAKTNVSFRMEAKMPADVLLYTLMPHMHMLGRTMKVDAVFPDGTERHLITIDDWDFNWQLAYRFREPLLLPKGTVIRTLASYDNTADNPRNPSSPPKPVRWGEQTTDEMMLLVAEIGPLGGAKVPQYFISFDRG